MGAENDEYEGETLSELSGIYAIWYREMKVFTREKSRILSSAINPILWLLIFGLGLGSSINIAGSNYQTFIFPGILVQTVMFSSIFFGVYIVMDKKIDFLKEVLVAPISRTSMFVGKVLGGATDTMIQISILLIVGFIFSKIGIMPDLSLNLYSVILSVMALFLTIVGMVSVGLIIGSQMDSPEGFQFIGSFVIMPLFFLSGALFPLENLPSWMSALTALNPIAYSVDAVRGIMIGTSHFGVMTDFAVIIGFSSAMIAIGTYAFSKMKV